MTLAEGESQPGPIMLSSGCCPSALFLACLGSPCSHCTSLSTSRLVLQKGERNFHLFKPSFSKLHAVNLQPITTLTLPICKIEGRVGLISISQNGFTEHQCCCVKQKAPWETLGSPGLAKGRKQAPFPAGLVRTFGGQLSFVIFQEESVLSRVFFNSLDQGTHFRKFK